jgi:hypothetical protein
VGTLRCGELCDQMAETMSRFPKKPKERTVPTEADWGDYKSDLDADYAHGVFASRTNVEMQDFDDLTASDAASCFLGLVEEKLESHPRNIMPIMPDLLPAVEHVARNQSAYYAEEHIYGNFLEKLEHIKALHEAQGGPDYSNQLNAFL